MKNYRTKRSTGAYITDAVLDANFGDVLYMREDGKIKAVKYVAVEMKDRDRKDTYRHLDILGCFLVAGEKAERKMTAFDAKMYRSISDCRQDINRIGHYTADASLMAIDAGLNVVGASDNIPVLSYYVWDGFYPKQKRFLLTAYVVRYDGKSFETSCVKDKKFYRTFEECEADNYLEVITFPEMVE